MLTIDTPGATISVIPINELLTTFGIGYSSSCSALDRQILLDNYLAEHADKTARIRSGELAELTDEHASLQGLHDDLEIELEATKVANEQLDKALKAGADRIIELVTIITGNVQHATAYDNYVLVTQLADVKAELASLKAFVGKKARKTLEAWEKTR